MKDINVLIERQELDEDYLNSNLSKLSQNSWMKLARFQNLSEDFIRKHKDKLDWRVVLTHQNLSEDFIEKECIDYINIHPYKDIYWDILSAHQELSKDFIKKYKNKLTGLHRNFNLKSKEEKIELIDDYFLVQNDLWGFLGDHENYFYSIIIGGHDGYYHNGTLKQKIELGKELVSNLPFKIKMVVYGSSYYRYYSSNKQYFNPILVKVNYDAIDIVNYSKVTPIVKLKKGWKFTKY